MTTCAPGPACSDGVVQGPEECDNGAANGTAEAPENGVPCDAGCRFAAKLAFVSSAVYSGGQLGGVEGAHLWCQKLAGLAHLDNAPAFRALISDATWSPLGGLAPISLPIVLRSGVRVADDLDDLFINGPGDGIVVTETGEIALDKKVWTGTAPSGKVFNPAQTCAGWSSSLPGEKARVGRTGVEPGMTDEWQLWDAKKEWISSDTYGCHYEWHLYCAEQ